MRERYYTPDLEELINIRTPYEFKYTHSNASSEWMEYDDEDYSYPFTSDHVEFRVKFLDHDDIISIGFSQITDDCFTLPLNDNSELRVLFKGDVVTIYLADFYDDSLFKGKLRNKSELMLILKMIAY